MNIDERLSKALESRVTSNSFRKLPVEINLVDFSSNDYLGLSRNPNLQADISKDLNNSPFKLGSGGSRLLAGNTILHEELEELLKTVHQSEAALLYNSGYMANLGVFSSIPQKGDTILYDEKVHVCIKEGMRLSFADRFSFKHNDLEHLESRLKRSTGQVFIAVESIYSMDGDQAPLNELVLLAQKYNAALIVDEAHSTGVYGKAGAGLCVELGLEENVFIRIHTFGKGIGSHGACVVGSKTVKDYLINFSRSFIYTTSMPEHQVLIIKNIYQYLIQNYKQLQATLNSNISQFKSEIKSSVISTSPIQVVFFEGNDRVREAAVQLQDKGFDVKPVMSPTVPKGKERLRVCLHAFNDSSSIKSLTEIISSIS